MLESLNADQEALLEQVYREYDSIFDSLPRQMKRDDILAWLAIVYKLYDMKVPDRLEIVGSPKAAFALEKELTGKTESTLDRCGVSDAGWVAFYDYFSRIGVLTKDESAEVLALREYQRSAWDSVLLDECAIVVQLPVKICRDQDGNLHCATGPARTWADGEKEYAWHGVMVPERMVIDPKSYTRAEYEAITQTEQRRVLGEAAGWEHIVTILGAKSENAWTDAKTGLSYELWSDGQSKWIRKQSPVLMTGNQPYYFEPVHEELKTAQAARKWQATELSVEECERDPVLEYGQET